MFVVCCDQIMKQKVGEKGGKPNQRPSRYFLIRSEAEVTFTVDRVRTCEQHGEPATVIRDKSTDPLGRRMRHGGMGAWGNGRCMGAFLFDGVAKPTDRRQTGASQHSARQSCSYDERSPLEDATYAGLVLEHRARLPHELLHRRLLRLYAAAAAAAS